MNRNYKMQIRYDGTRYLGWEHQPGREWTIQGKIETVLTRMIEEEREKRHLPEKETQSLEGFPKERGVNGTLVDVIAAGRTDAGVHARAMTANVILDSVRTPQQIQSFLNHYLPEDISIDQMDLASPHFHARYNAKGKTYQYTCWYSDRKPVFDRKYVTVLSRRPDTEAMRRAAGYLMGEHDFKSFCGNSHFKKSSVRLLDRIEIQAEDPYLKFVYHGNGFLQNMVRILTGTLLETGYGKRKPEEMTDILQARDRKSAGFTAPPCGLTLISVDY